VSALKVLYVSYPSAFQNIGGGEILLLKMKEYVEKTGVEVKLFDMWRDKIEDYDLVHVFGSVKECLGIVRVANARGTKVAISPLFWSSWKRAFGAYGGLREKADLFLRHAVKLAAPAFPSGRRSLMLASDLIFPNSVMEQKQIARLFAVPESRMTVVYNGVDRRFETADPGPWRARHGGGDFILTVGRIEPRKNQLNLIRAVRRMSGMKLVVIGNPVSGFESYARDCREAGEGFVRFAGGFAHEDPMLASAYAAARVYALPAWFETPGLVAMEAALAGSHVAATEGGSTREYFGDRVEYFDPGRPDTIAAALTRTLARKDQAELKKHILDHFTWQKVAADTVAAYRRCVGRN
jgi:glycosyltransferase involved in cell wall biosynthesis